LSGAGVRGPCSEEWGVFCQMKQFARIRN
jgi:hypothetical protein